MKVLVLASASGLSRLIIWWCSVNTTGSLKTFRPFMLAKQVSRPRILKHKENRTQQPLFCIVTGLEAWEQHTLRLHRQIFLSFSEEMCFWEKLFQEQILQFAPACHLFQGEESNLPVCVYVCNISIVWKIPSWKSVQCTACTYKADSKTGRHGMKSKKRLQLE